MIGIADEWAAYQFDLAVMRLGWHVEAGLAKKQSLASLLADPDDHAARYGDVRQFGPVRTVKLDADGTW